MSWTNRQRQYQFFLATPETLRPKDCKTETDFAKKFELKPETLALWKLAPGWWQAVYDVSLNTLGTELPAILSALAGKAKAGNVSAIKLALQALGTLVEKSQQEVRLDDDSLVVVVNRADRPRKGAESAEGEDTPPLFTEGSRDGDE